jgi:hypothetical protein
MADMTFTSRTMSIAKDHPDTSWLIYCDGHAIQKPLPDGEEDKLVSLTSMMKLTYL